MNAHFHIYTERNALLAIHCAPYKVLCIYDFLVLFLLVSTIRPLINWIILYTFSIGKMRVFPPLHHLVEIFRLFPRFFLNEVIKRAIFFGQDIFLDCFFLCSTIILRRELIFMTQVFGRYPVVPFQKTVRRRKLVSFYEKDNSGVLQKWKMTDFFFCFKRR